ncbi:MAG TPA: hypothetical protein VG269_23760 [Tepidisphaeraceae bacterium]|jgi:hypothetical protein|nr:hypothetical protein [Tepidisphaeraceae bacterium]
MPLSMCPQPHNLARKWRRVLKIVAVGLPLLCIFTYGVLGAVCRSQVTKAVKQGTGADLKANWSWYVPPYGVSLRGVRVTKPGPDGQQVELLAASRIDLKLARLPHKGQPLVIDSLVVQSPTLTLANNPEPPREPEPQPLYTQPPPAVVKVEEVTPPPKNSDKFQLHHLQISNARVVYEDRAPAGTQAIELSRLQVNVTGDPASAGRYTYGVAVEDPDRVTLRISGDADINALVVQVPQLSIKARLAALAPELPMSHARRETLAPFLTDGTLDVSGKATIPLHDVQHAAIDAAITLDGAKANLSRLNLTVDRADAKFSIHSKHGPTNDPRPAALDVEKFQIVSGKTVLVLDGGALAITPDGAGWDLTKLLGRLDIGGGVPALDRQRLRGRFNFAATAGAPFHLPNGQDRFVSIRHDLIAYPKEVSIQPPKFDVPIEHIGGGQISFRGGVVRLQNLIAQYGHDQVLLEDAHVTLDDSRQRARLGDLREQVRIEGIAGTLIFHQPATPYPAALGKVIAQLRPTGAFDVGGGSWYAINRKHWGEWPPPKPDYFFRVATTQGTFALYDAKIPLQNIHGDATISPMSIEIPHFKADVFEGTVTSTARITPVRPVRYDGSVLLYNVNLDKASAAVAPPDGKGGRLSGRGFAKAHLAGGGPGGTRTPKQLFAGDGEFEVLGGDFSLVPVVKQAAAKVARPDQPMVGQAAGLFTIRDEVVVLNRCAVGNPLFGLQGSGTIGFDKSLDLQVVAAPLGDWHDALKEQKIPVLDDIAGAIQQVISGAQRTLLWDIHVQGTTTDPKVITVPAPAITEPVAAIFGAMLGEKKDAHLIDAVKAKPAAPVKK